LLESTRLGLDDGALFLGLVARVLPCLGPTFPWRFPIGAQRFDNCLLNIRFFLRRLLLLEVWWNVRLGHLGLLRPLDVLGLVDGQAQLLHRTPDLVRLEEVRVSLRHRLLVLTHEGGLRVLLLRQLQLIEIFERAQEGSRLLAVTLRELLIVVVWTGHRCLLALSSTLSVAFLACLRTFRPLVPLELLLAWALYLVRFRIWVA